LQQDIDLIFDSIPLFMRAVMNGFHDVPGRCTKTHFKALKILENHDGLSLSELSSRMNMEKGSVSPVVHTLVEQGFCERSRDAGDRRVLRLHLTEAGREAMNTHIRELSVLVRKNLEPVSAKDRAAMRTALQTLHRIAEEMFCE